MNRYHRLLVCTMVAVLALAGCGSDSDTTSTNASSGSSPAAEKPVTVGLVMPIVQQSAHYRLIAEGAKAEAAKMKGVTLKFQSTAGQYSPQKYLDAIDSVTGQSVAAIAFDPYDPKLFKPVIRRLTNQGVKVVNVGNPPIPGEAASVNTDTEGAIKAEVEQMVSQMGGSGKVGFIEFPGNGVVSKRVADAKQAVGETGATVGPSAPLAAECVAVPAANATQDLLAANKDLKAIFAPCGAPAVGAATAIAQAKRDVLLYAFDLDADIARNIERGRITASVAQRPRELGARAVRVLVALARGQTVPATTKTGFDVVTKDNVKDFLALTK